jgi:hypothetical protein
VTGLKLAKLPDRTPVKVAIIVYPDLNRSLHAYAELYREAYGANESVAELIPYMLEAFLKSDHGFARARREGAPPDRPTSTPPPRRGRRRTGPDGSLSTTSDGE